MKIYNFIIKALAKIRRIFRYYIVKNKLKNKKYTHMYIGSPVHGNLGDQQIRKSAIEFLNKNKIKFIELSLAEYNSYKNLDLKNIKHILMHGGGNLGDVYLVEKKLKDEIISKYLDKKITIFPQTFYCNNYESEGMLHTKEIFSNHKNLTIVAREEKSFEMMKKFFNKNKIIKTPDIVLSSDYSKKQYKRKNALFLIRRDIEKSLKEEDFKLIKTEIEKDFKTIICDTVVDKKVNEVNRDYELKKIFKKIKKSQIVVTDRLHGMVFCAITNTPCIVLSNYNHKVKGTYEWIKHLDYIKFIEKIDNVKKYKNEVLTSNSKYEPLTEKYNVLKDILGEN